MQPLLNLYSRVHQKNVVGDGKVKSHASCLQADQENLDFRFVLKRLQNLKKRGDRVWPKKQSSHRESSSKNYATN